MKNIINYFYNFNIDNLRMINDDYYFVYEGENFVFQEVKDRNFDYQAIFELNRSLIVNNKIFFRIIVNKNNDIITTNANKQYILMMYNLPVDRNIELYDVIESNSVVKQDNKLINKLNRSNWIDLWKNKIDYFEMYLSHNINKYTEFNKYANYFIGLGENAISYVEETVREEKPNIYDNLVVSHKRLSSSEGLKQLYNPLNLIVDHSSRDIAGYLKMIFWNNEYLKKDLEKYLNSLTLSNYGARLIIARMLFPSFLFDSFEKMIEEKITEKDIIYMIDKINDYEKYLLKIYYILKNNYSLSEISWLKKVDYSSTFTTPSTSGTSFINMDSMPSFSVTSIMLQ